MADGKRGRPFFQDGLAKSHPLTVPLTAAVLDKLQRYAQSIGMTKTVAARRLIEDGVDELRKRRVET